MRPIMKTNKFSYVILFTWQLSIARCEFYSSIHEVTKLVDYERYLLGKMERFVTINESKLDYLKEKLAEFEHEHADAAEAGEKYFENPINKYLLTKRLSLDWEKLANFLEHEVGSSTLTSIDEFRANYTFPDENDFGGAIEGLLRLQKVYRLNAKDLAQGILKGIKYTGELSAKDCYDIGMYAFDGNLLLAAHAWLMEALDRSIGYEQSILDAKFEKPDILEPLAEVKFKLHDYNGAVEYAYALNLWRPYDNRLLEIYKSCREHANKYPSVQIKSEHEPIPVDLDAVGNSTAYQLTCNGHIKQTPAKERELRCRYLTETHPFLTLAPIKVEQLHADPMLVVFHDVISDYEIKKVIALADENIERATVLSDNGSVISPVRTSQYAFFSKKTDKVLQTIDARVADMTGLNMDTAEQHQVSNYGIGGHYVEHTDFFDAVDMEIVGSENGNRIATVLFYMTDVEQGGGTAFPYMKSLLKPQKGSAAFWYNLHASGDGDYLTTHGACPVLVGSKWVLNRWILERGQEFKRPCKLYSDAVCNSSML